MQANPLCPIADIRKQTSRLPLSANIKTLSLRFRLWVPFVGEVKIPTQWPLPLPLLLEHLRIGRRSLVRLGEVGERKREADLVAGEVDRLDGQHLALLELADQVGGPLVVRHAAVREAGEERHRDRRLLLVDDEARAVAQLQRARQRDAEDL